MLQGVLKEAWDLTAQAGAVGGWEPHEQSRGGEKGTDPFPKQQGDAMG